MKILSTVLLALVLMTHQDAGAQVVGVRALALGKGAEMPERFVKTKDGFVAMAFSVIEPSEMAKALVGPAGLPLFERLTNEDGEVSFQVAQQVKLPSGCKSILLLGWTDKDEAHYLAIDDTFLSANYNDWLLINAASKDVAFQLGYDQKPLLIKANSVKQHRLDAEEESGISVIGQAQWGEKTKTFYATYWPVRSGQRGIVIFYSHKDRIAVRRISDVLHKAETSKETAEVP